MGKRWDVALKKVILEYEEACGKDAVSYREFGVSRCPLYQWRRAYRQNGTSGLMPRKPVALWHPKALASETIDKIIELRKGYSLGPQRICWYLERYQGIRTFCPRVYPTLIRHGLGLLSRNVARRDSIPS